MKLAQIVNSLAFRLIGLGLVMAVLGTAMSYSRLTDFLRQDLGQIVAAQQTTLAEYVAHDVNASIEERRQFIDQLAAGLPPALVEQPAGLRDWLRERQQLQPLFSLGLLVADPQGRVLADFPELPGRTGASIAGYPGFQIAMAGPTLVGSPVLGVVSKLPMLPVTAPVRDAQGRAVALLIGTAEVSAKGFLGRLLQGHIGNSGGVLLVSPRDRLVVASTDSRQWMSPLPAAGIDPLHDKAMTGFRGSTVTVDADGVETLSAVASVPGVGWYVVARLPTTEAFATVGRAQSFIVRQRLIGMLLLLTVVGAIVLWLLRPLYRAADQADRMTRGDIALAPLPVVRDDEVGHLTTAFNRLLATLVEKQSELGRLAHHDELTGLPNRKLLADRMQLALARAQRHSSRVAVLFMDLDGFKTINDTLGHEAGDRALQEIAQRLSSVIRREDTLARVGGDEFVLLAGDLLEPAQHSAATLAEKCIAATSSPLHLQGVEHVIGVSIGIALSDGNGSAEDLLAAADKAMYEAKQGGRRRYVLAG